ncbi:hypothetical protein [Haladaptatus sp. NG-WS-4]
MQQVTARIPDEMVSEFEQRSSEHNMSKSDVIRDVLSLGFEYDTLRDEYGENIDDLLSEYESSIDEYEEKVDDLQSELDELQTECERLRREKRQILAQQEEKRELVKYVEEERSLAERREERATAPAWKRMKWWLTGYDGADQR